MGGKKCMMVFCKNRGPIPGIKYFRLTAARRDPWLRAIGRNPNAEPLTEANRICSIHFAKDDIIIIDNRICLKPGAIPTQHLGNNRLLPSLKMSSLTSISTINYSSEQKNPSTEVDALVTPMTSEPGHDLHNNENIIEEGVCFNYLEVPNNNEIDINEELCFKYLEVTMDDEESLSSVSTLDPLSVPSTGEEIDSYGIISIIYILVGIFIFCSIKSNKEILPVKQIKRKLEIMSSSEGEDENTIKKAKEDVKIIHSYSKNPNHLEDRLKTMTEKKYLYQEKVKNVTRKVKRLTQKVQSLKKVLCNLKKKNLLDKEALSLLNETDSLNE